MLKVVDTCRYVSMCVPPTTLPVDEIFVVYKVGKRSGLNLPEKGLIKCNLWATCLCVLCCHVAFEKEPCNVRPTTIDFLEVIHNIGPFYPQAVCNS